MKKIKTSSQAYKLYLDLKEKEELAKQKKCNHSKYDTEHTSGHNGTIISCKNCGKILEY